MSVPAQRALRSAINNRQFDPVYYLHGDDDYRKDEAVSQLVAAAVDPATREFNFDTFRGADVDAERLSVALTALPMFADRRVVVVRDIGALKKAARAELDRYVLNPARETLLVLTAPAGDKADTELAVRTTAVGFPPLSGDSIATWLTQYVTRHEATISEAAAALVAEAIGGDLGHGASELDKLMAYAGTRTIDVADVEAVVGLRRGETMVDLLNAVAERDGARACALVEPVLAQPKTTGVQTVMMLATQTLAMAWGRAARDGGMSASRLESEFFALMKTGGGYPGRAWGDAAKCWARNLPRWSGADLSRALEQLCAADVALKDTKVSSEAAIVSSLVLALCVSGKRREAA